MFCTGQATFRHAQACFTHVKTYHHMIFKIARHFQSHPDIFKIFLDMFQMDAHMTRHAKGMFWHVQIYSQI